MCADFTDEEAGKRVVAQDGAEVGTVEEVRDGELYVEVGPDANGETLDQLGWEGVVEQEVHQLRQRFVSNVSERTIRLRV